MMPKKYFTPEDAYEAHKIQARNWYWKKKGITPESIQERINKKRLDLSTK